MSGGLSDEAPLACLLAMRSFFRDLSLLAGLAVAITGGGTALMVIVSLISEDQRQFLSCRAAGSGVDACLLVVNGR